MSNGKAIQIRGLGKCYEIDQRKQQESYETVRGAIRQTLSNLWSGRTKTQKTEFWALRDVEFDIEKGDRLAIIGPNGAGKSTLFKILSRVTNPTTGEIKISGMLTSLLEVGTGFHPELTGRENIFLNGSILGMSRNDIARQMDEIIAFAGVESFIDVPLKRYSSGMAARLGFAVAAHLQSDIMIVDEVLAVGDAAFQKKCLGKMDDVSKSEGRTIIFVSHSISTVQQLCNKGVVLNHGRVVSCGDIISAVKSYEKLISDNGEAFNLVRKLPEIDLLSTTLVGDAACDDIWKISFVFSSSVSIKDCFLDFGIYNEKFFPIVHVMSAQAERFFDIEPGKFRIDVSLPSIPLNLGNYQMIAYLAAANGSVLYEARDISVASIIRTHSYTGPTALLSTECDILVTPLLEKELT